MRKRNHHLVDHEDNPGGEVLFVSRSRGRVAIRFSEDGESLQVRGLENQLWIIPDLSNQIYVGAYPRKEKS